MDTQKIFLTLAHQQFIVRMAVLVLILSSSGHVQRMAAQELTEPKDSAAVETVEPSAAESDQAGTDSPLGRILPPSPQAAALARYGEYPVSLATGIPEINIPLYEIKLGDYALPISIS